MDATPDTFTYMLAGYVIFAVIMVVYLASLISRWNNLRRDLQTLNEIERSKQ
jgi:hypothetical protein